MQALATFISWTFLGVIISTQERTFTSQMACTFEFSPPGYARADTIGHAPPFCASCRAVRLGAGSVYQEAIRHLFGTGQLTEDVVPCPPWPSARSGL
jgi:hypothetical protein